MREEVLQVLAFEVLHDDVGGSVPLEEVLDAHHAVGPVEACEHSGFAQEALLAVLGGFSPGAAERDKGRYRRDPAREAGRVVFLHGDAIVEHVIEADVGDAEAALAERQADEVALLEERAGHELVRFLRLLGRRDVASAMGAALDIGRELAHALVASCSHARLLAFLLVSSLFRASLADSIRGRLL